MSTFSGGPQVHPPPAFGNTAEMLRRTKPWVRFLSIVGFVTAGLTILAGVGFGFVGLATGQVQMLIMFGVYPVLGILYIFPSLYLYRYADRIRDFLVQGQQYELDAALEAQKSFWKFVGIFTLVCLCLYPLILLIVIVGAVVAA